MRCSLTFTLLLLLLLTTLTARLALLLLHLLQARTPNLDRQVRSSVLDKASQLWSCLLTCSRSASPMIRMLFFDFLIFLETKSPELGIGPLAAAVRNPTK